MNESIDSDIAVFCGAVRLSVAERGAFLDHACEGDGALRGRVEALLRAHENAGDFLVAPLDGVPKSTSSPVSGRVGDRVGRYKLLEQIGEGGCGIVFKADQEEPVRRQVALKLVKPGMDTKGVVARFEAERQALALMEHPNIAQIFDAGATESGRPYFVMELVQGVKITDYCDQNSLTTRARLALFVEICDAVQHAHQKGIIHRDLKPSNILITTSITGKPLPKIIDFGIAKATTGQRLADHTLLTAAELLLGTPAYMSPEQAALTSVDVDTRSDIYSLGVLLYELLTGATPLDTRELLKAGLDEIRRAVRDQEPVLPSTKLSTMKVLDLTTVCRRRLADPPNLVREVRGDLDWIVMKALEKDRDRRYVTANALAMDIRHYLCGEAIVARPPSASYRFRKLVSRNKLWFGAGAMVFASLVVGLGMTSWSLAHEKHARREADALRIRAEADERTALTDATQSHEVTRFLKDMLAAVGPSVARGRDTTMLREVLEKTSDRVGSELTNEPAVQAELWTTIGSVWSQLRLYDKAEPALSNALEIRRKLLGNDSLPVADSLLSLAQVLVQLGKLDGAESLCRESLAIRRKLFGEESKETAAGLDLFAIIEYQHRDKWAVAETLARQVVALRRKLLSNDGSELARSLVILASILDDERKPSEAETVDREALDIYRKRLADDDPLLAPCLNRLALILRKEGKLPEAESTERELLASLRKTHDEFHMDVSVVLVNLAEILRRENKRSEIAPLLQPLLQVDPVAHPEAINQLQRRADRLAQSGLWMEARADAEKALEFRPDDPGLYHLLAPLLVACEDSKSDEELCGRIVARFKRTTDVLVADPMAKDCLTLPIKGIDLNAVAAMADVAASKASENSFYQVCKALAEYRQGHFAAAVQWAAKASQNKFPYSGAEAKAILAMGQFHLNQVGEARVSASEAGMIVMNSMPAIESGDLSHDWRDWIIAHALLREATNVLEEASIAGKTPSSK
jgi:serine/threonine protein kinase/tetratricopeptide (TPR) repeat protein